MRVFLLVLSGAGVGGGAEGEGRADTLAHLGEAAGGLRAPALARAGLGATGTVPGVRATAAATGAFGTLVPRAPGVDPLASAWELAGHLADPPLESHPDGFPTGLLDGLAQRLGRGWVGNVAGPTAEVLDRFDGAHRERRDFIVYTSASSVMRVAAHVEVVARDALEDACREARAFLDDRARIGRVVARPFDGAPGRVAAAGCREFAARPETPALPARIARTGARTVAVGRGRTRVETMGVDDSVRTSDDEEALEVVLDLARRPGSGLVWAALDGLVAASARRGDARGFGRAFEIFDDRYAALVSRLRHDELCIVTGDHGRDATVSGGRRTRERAPLVVSGPGVRPGVALGERDRADVAATVAELFRAPASGAGRSFRREIRS